jgi:hypothetical protein
MQEVKFVTLDFSNAAEVRRVAEIHEWAPKHWEIDYRPTDEQLEARTKQLQEQANNDDNRGIASKLKARGEEWAKQKKISLIVTRVAYNNQNMIDLNLKRGFRAGQVEMIKELK